MIALADLIDGVYPGMPYHEYRDQPALSYSGIKKLRISPLTYWDHYINPNRPEESSSPAKDFGHALHSLVLEPEKHSQRYARDISKEDYRDVLVTMDDLRAYCEANGLKVTAKRKEELIDRINLAGHKPPIWDSLVAQHARDNADKIILSPSDDDRLHEAASVIVNDPTCQNLLKDGEPELSVIVRDPQTGVLLKGRIDYCRTRKNVDIKTFTNSREKPIRRAVMDEIHHRGYLGQAVMYHAIRELAIEQGIQGAKHLRGLPEVFTFIFIESERPHHLEVVEIHPDDSTVHWAEAVSQVRAAIDLYAECVERWGHARWCGPAKAHVLEDRDIPQLAFT